MNDISPASITVFRFVAIFGATKLLAMLLLVISAQFIDIGSSSGLSTSINIAAVCAAMGWYARTVGRRLKLSENIRFSLGTVLVDLILSVAWLGVAIWFSGASLSWDGLGTAMSFDAKSRPSMLAIIFGGIAIGSLATFATSSIFAWLVTRKLPVTAPSAK